MTAERILRFCIPINFGDGILETDGSHLKGIVGDRFNPFIEIAKNYFNITSRFKENFDTTHRINSSDAYTGCLGELQRGESDFMFVGMNYPVDVVNVSQGFIILDERTSFLGAFVRPDAVRAADFTSSFDTFHWSLYVIIAVYIYMLFLILRLRRAMHVSLVESLAGIPRFKRIGRTTFRCKSAQLAEIESKIKRYKEKHGISMLNVVHHFLGSKYIDRRSFFVDQVTLLISCFSFFIFTYYYSLFNTELVSSGPAKIHENYRDLMKHNVKPLFVSGTTYHEALKEAEPGTPERQLWDWAVAKNGEEKLFATRNLRELAKLAHQGFYGELVYFTGSSTAGILKSLFCQIASRSWDRLVGLMGAYTPVAIDMVKNDDWQIYTRYSESAEKMIKTMVVSKRLEEDVELFQIVKYIFSKVFEIGLIEAELRGLDRMDILSNPAIENLIGPSVPDRIEMKHRCLENNALVPKLPEIDRLMPSYFLVASKVFATVLCVALCCLLCEKAHHAIYSRRGSRRNSYVH